jgi:hypothetical protein
VVALFLTSLAIAFATTTSASAATAAPSPAGHERCCFELDVAAYVSFGAEYPCDLPGYTCDDPNKSKYPWGGHAVVVQWDGREIVSYHETRKGTPLLGEVFAGQARVRVDQIQDSARWAVSPDDNSDESCTVVRSTLPSASDTNPHDGFMRTESLLEFVPPKGTLEVNAGLALDHVFATKCGLGFDHHGENASRAAWGGLNSPWVWTLKGPSRARWRHGNLLYKVLHQTLSPGVLQPEGFCWDRSTYSSLSVVLTYFPHKALATRARAFRRSYPITSQGLNTLVDQTSQGFSAGPANYC